MAIACLGLVTFLPLRPDFSWPFFISFISVSTFLLAEGEYLRPEDFFAEVFLAEDFRDEAFFEDDFFAPVLFLVLLFRAAELLFLALLFLVEELFFFVRLELFFAAFFVAIAYSPRKSDVRRIRVSCMAVAAQVYS